MAFIEKSSCLADAVMLRSVVLDDISSQKLASLNKLKPMISAGCILVEWLIVAALIAIAKSVPSPWVVAFAVLLIGSRQHSLAVLMHEGAHYHLANHRGLNDRIAELFTAWPLFISLPTYRKSHFEHHAHANTMEDPDWRRKQNADWAFPKTPLQMAQLWLKVLFFVPAKIAIFCLLIDCARFFNRQDRKREVLRALFYVIGALAILRMHLGMDFLVFWIVPFFFVFMPIAHLRSIAEHFGLENNPADPLTQTRTTKAGLVESFLICPNNINYHLDHHLAPSVPFYNLPALHHLLGESSLYARKASITYGYLGVIGECLY